MDINPYGTEWLEIRSHIDERIKALHAELEMHQTEESTAMSRGAIAELRRLIALVAKPAPTGSKGPDYSLRK